MAQKRPVAPDTPITSYPTPKVSDVVITVDVDSRLPGYKPLEYGELYYDQTRFPGAKLISQAPLDDDRFVRRIYATDRVDQDTYNYAIKYSAGSPDYPIYTRTTIELRDTYAPLPDNTPDPVISGAYLVDEEAVPADGELNSLYLKVVRVYETLPGPWVPYSRYDDDLGPVQGRRRSVINQGQVASLTATTRTGYEARDNSTGVYIETEETWSTRTDENGNSLFPIKDRDFYDPSRGAVQERRQLFVPTGNEVATLENINGVITQTSYEPYNEYLSIKIVQTYSVNGPSLVSKATDGDGQLVTITTQRKASLNYTPTSPTATKTIEAAAEDAESLVEKITETPEVFTAEAYSVERPDLVPEKFRVKFKTKTSQKNIEGIATIPTLGTGELSKSEQQVNKFVKKTSTTSRDVLTTETLVGYQLTTELGGGVATVTETYPYTGPTPTPQFGVIADEIENLADGTNLRRTVALQEQRYTSDALTEDTSGYPTSDGLPVIYSMPELTGQDYDEELDITIPFTQVVVKSSDKSIITGNRRRSTPRDVAHTQIVKYNIADVQSKLDSYYWEIPEMVTIKLPDKLISVSCPIEGSAGNGSGSGVGDTYFWNYSKEGSKRGKVIYDIEEGFAGNIPATRAIFFLPKDDCSPEKVRQVVASHNAGGVQFFPNARPKQIELVVFGGSFREEQSQSVSFDASSQSTSGSSSFSIDSTIIPPTIHTNLTVGTDVVGGSLGPSVYVRPNQIPATTPYSVFPTGRFIYQINSSPYKFSYVKVEAIIVTITTEYV